MSEPVTVSFAKHNAAPKGVVVVLTDESLAFGAATQKLVKGADAALTRAFDAERYKGKAWTGLDLLAPAGLEAPRLIVISVGKARELKSSDFLKLGGLVAGKIPASAREATLVLDLPGAKVSADDAAEVGLGIALRSYSFDRYKTKKKDEADHGTLAVTLLVADEPAAKRAYAAKEAVADGVILARDLVNEPPNVLDPPEFARRAEALKKVGVEVEVFDDADLARLGMRALLGVGQGSIKESRVVVMQWRGGAKGDAPVAFIGKGVTFDTGGISIKPALGMEDMKGDMGGAACVTGLMHALAARKAKVNAVGVIGIVENMPDGAAQRPGDIVTSLSGQTIEIVNTDAEGRLVLADVLWYAKERFKPKFMIDLATLTGAILVALGSDHAGLFSNDNELAERLAKAGQETGEKVWRLPLGQEYDKLIDSKFADMKNTGGRNAGSITAAQFLKRFVDKTPWAHLDVAGTAMSSPPSDINKSWGSGWGVRLLNQLVKDHYEG
ncbi:leucyl aminopeptidase [Xanthobacter tagetidis]|uniref:Probable cytosol aminopeptidase n=1 Tax=Xanthobacter tagetidis TaxID=60216 RepID=A0A3L7AF15_9HYPH|nr:leucyl aminopeptidase [Xanthobacter tagetidis]MBB6306636.1 leucyl aminopeptidase [Xanthobacter tagetidis]RLP79046.1 leucyl aminopeptidase [Xanthobacter tagetidis]